MEPNSRSVRITIPLEDLETDVMGGNSPTLILHTAGVYTRVVVSADLDSATQVALSGKLVAATANWHAALCAQELAASCSDGE